MAIWVLAFAGAVVILHLEKDTVFKFEKIRKQTKIT